MSVVRWRRYGKDRLYVTAADGAKLGCRDLLTGADHPESPETAEGLTAAVTVWLAANADVPVPAAPALTAPAPSAPAATPADEPAPTHPAATAPPAAPVPPAPELPASAWEDLAERRAGAAAREQAVALRQAAPIRTFVARVLGVHTDERAWRIGADGEELVAAQLAKLAKRDPRWFFLHAIPVGENGADIDHLVIGPGGVFTLNAKNHPGAKIWVGGNTFMVNGNRQPYLRNSRFEASRAGKLLTAACGLPVTATGVIVPVNADDLVIKAEPADVIVINRMRLVRRLLEHPQRLDEQTIALICAAARRSTTWRTSV